MGDATVSAPLAAGAAGGERARAPAARYGLLLIATLLSLIVQGTVAPSPVQRIVVTALAGASLMLAFRAAELPARAVRVAALLATAGVVVAVVRATAGGVGDGAARVMNATLIGLGPPAVAVGVIRDLRSSGQVRIQSVMGVLSFYLLVGMAFGFVYGAIDRMGGDPFFADGSSATVAHCLYFSFVTLTTTGYGDLVARTDLGHTLSILEALMGQIYLVTIVSMIVSNLGRPAAPPRLRRER